MYYLYVKTHNITGLKYMGHTKQDPQKYKGSGLYWKRHIKTYGYDVVTEILLQSELLSEISAKGKELSVLWNIVESPEWANFKIEEGDGGFNQDQVRKTLIEKYGVDNCMKVPEIAAKNRKSYVASFKKRYGVDNPSHVKEFVEKGKTTKADPTWKNTVGTGMLKKQQAVKDSKEWKENVGPKISSTKRNPEWQAENSTSCSYCGKIELKWNITRYHNDKCKNRSLSR